MSSDPMEKLSEEVNDVLRLSASIPPPAPPLTESMTAELALKEEIANVLAMPPHERKAMKDVLKKRQEREQLTTTLMAATAKTSSGGESELRKSKDATLDRSSVNLNQSIGGGKRLLDETRLSLNASGMVDSEAKPGDAHPTPGPTETDFILKREEQERARRSQQQRRLSVEERLARDAFAKEIADEMVEYKMQSLPTVEELQHKAPHLNSKQGYRYMLDHNILYVVIRDTLSQYPMDAHLRINQYLTEKGFPQADLIAFRAAWSEVLANNEMFGRSKIDPNHKINPSLFAEECLKALRSRVSGMDELERTTKEIMDVRAKILEIQEEEQRERNEYEEKWRYAVDENGNDILEYPVDVTPASAKIEEYMKRRKERYLKLLSIRRLFTRVKRSLRQFTNEIYALPPPTGPGGYLRKSKEVMTQQEELEIIELISRYQDSCGQIKVILDPLPRGAETGLSFWEMYKRYTPIWHLRLPIPYHSYRFGKLKMIRRHAVDVDNQSNKRNANDGASVTAMSLPLFCSTDRIIAIDVDQEHCRGNELDAWETYTFLLDFVWLKDFNPFPKPLDAIPGDNQDKCNILFLFEYPDAIPFHSMVSAELAILLRKFPDILVLWCIQLAMACHGMDYCEGKLFCPFHYTFNLNITNDGLLLFQDLLLLDNINEKEHIYKNSPKFRYFKKDVFKRRRGFDPYRGLVSTRSVVGTSGKENKDDDDNDDQNGELLKGMTLEEVEVDELLEKEEKEEQRYAEEHIDDFDDEEFDSDDGDDAFTGNNNVDLYNDPYGLNPYRTGYEDKDYDYIERYVMNREKDIMDNLRKRKLTKEDNNEEKKDEKQKNEKDKKQLNSNETFELASINPIYPFNFANFVPWVYDILQVATAASRHEILRLKQVSTFHRLGYALKFPQYVFDKKIDSATKQTTSTVENESTKGKGENKKSTTSARDEAIQYYLDDEPVALSPYQTFSIMVGNELAVELYCGEVKDVFFHEYDKVYGVTPEKNGQTVGGGTSKTSVEDYLRASSNGENTLPSGNEVEDNPIKRIFNGQFDPEENYHDLHIVKRIDELCTFKVDPNNNPYENMRYDGPRVRTRISNINSTALLQSKILSEPYCAYILNKNGRAMYASRDINNCRAHRSNLLPKRYNAIFHFTSDVPCVMYLEFSNYLLDPLKPTNSERRTGGLKIQFVPNIPAVTPEAQDVLVSLEEFYRTKVPSVLFRSHPFITAKDVWRDNEKSKDMIVNGSVAWGKMKKRIQQGQSHLS